MTPGLQQPKVWGQQAWSCFGRFFHGNKGAMEEAARVGDIFEHEGLWYSKRVETGRTKELKDAMQLSGGKAQLSVDEYSDMSSWLQDRPWSKYGEQLPELGNSSACSCQ